MSDGQLYEQVGFSFMLLQKQKQEYVSRWRYWLVKIGIKKNKLYF